MAYRGNMEPDDIEDVKKLSEDVWTILHDIHVEEIAISVKKDGTYIVDVSIDPDNSWHLISREDGDVENRWYVRREKPYVCPG